VHIEIIYEHHVLFRSHYVEQYIISIRLQTTLYMDKSHMDLRSGTCDENSNAGVSVFFIINNIIDDIYSFTCNISN